jgi:diazepam-binding inhibitor (GABA receptor modulator, acyl-CoA-binding protein)
MTSNSVQFINASDIVKKLSSTPSNNEMKILYGLYKQATVGDNNTPPPSMFNFKEMTKHSSWLEYKGDSTYTAEVKYINLVNELITKYGITTS